MKPKQPENRRKINIAVDGVSSCGKGTLAKNLAHHLGYTFVDTGAMYRAVTYAILKDNINLHNTNDLKNLLKGLLISFSFVPEKNYYNTLLNGRDVEFEIRGKEVSEMVSPVSAIPEIRKYLVHQQQEIGRNKGVVMDGRDIGSVVFPDAELKIFMTATVEVRAKRRFLELQEKGATEYTYDDVLLNLKNRDYMDTHREFSPLMKVRDAKVIDNTFLSKEEQLQLAINWAEQIIVPAS